MPQWGDKDQANNSVVWGPSLLNTVANSTTVAALYGNTTANAFITDAKVGQFGVTADEAEALREGGTETVAHAGWNLRTEGTGGRAGRVTYETLVAMGSMTGDGDGNTVSNYAIVVTTDPANATGNSAANESVTYTVAAKSVPAGATLTYLWQYTTSAGNTETFATTAAVSGFSGQTTTTLTVNSAVIADGTLVRAVVSSANGAPSVNSGTASLTVTS